MTKHDKAATREARPHKSRGARAATGSREASLPMNSETMRATLRTTKALSDLQRIRILLLLQPSELCVCQIVAVLGLAPSTVSKHLTLLDAARLVDCRKEGRWSYYRVRTGPAAAHVSPLLNWLEDALRSDQQILRDRNKLQEVQRVDAAAPCRGHAAGGRGTPTRGKRAGGARNRRS